MFFIFLVSNIGGSLTPLGDPPLFLGFLRGVDFFWTHDAPVPADAVRRRRWCSALFFVVDAALYLREKEVVRPLPRSDAGLAAARRRRLVNFALIGVDHRGDPDERRLEAGHQLRGRAAPTSSCRTSCATSLFIAVAFASLALTPPADREANGFSWGPIQEVAKLFAGIFLAHHPGARDAARRPRAAPSRRSSRWSRTRTERRTTPPIFWLSGGLSSFLDNAPTYLVFFELAGGDPAASR